MHERTIQDMIASKSVLQVVCRRCRHGALLFPWKLAEAAGETATIAEVSERLRCSKCNNAAVNVYEAAR